SIHRLVQAVLQDAQEETEKRWWAELAVRAVNHVFPDVDFGTWQACQRYISQAHWCASIIERWKINLPEASRLLFQAGNYLSYRGQSTQAEPLIKQVLTIQEQTLGPEHPDIARSLSLLADIYDELGDYAQAEPLYQRTL